MKLSYISKMLLWKGIPRTTHSYGINAEQFWIFQKLLHCGKLFYALYSCELLLFFIQLSS